MDWETYSNLDALLKLFRSSKGDFCHVLLSSLWNIPTILLKEKAAHLHDEVVDNLQKVKDVRMNQIVTMAIYSDRYSTFFFLIFRCHVKVTFTRISNLQ